MVSQIENSTSGPMCLLVVGQTTNDMVFQVQTKISHEEKAKAKTKEDLLLTKNNNFIQMLKYYYAKASIYKRIKF